MIYNSHYMLLDSNDDVFVILTDRDIVPFFEDILSIEHAVWQNSKIILKNKERSLEIPIVSSNDVLLLNRKEKMVSFIDKQGEVINIIEIKGV